MEDWVYERDRRERRSEETKKRQLLLLRSAINEQGAMKYALNSCANVEGDSTFFLPSHSVKCFANNLFQIKWKFSTFLFADSFIIVNELIVLAFINNTYTGNIIWWISLFFATQGMKYSFHRQTKVQVTIRINLAFFLCASNSRFFWFSVYPTL